MAAPVYVPNKSMVTFEQHKKRAQRHVTKHKPAAPAPVALTNSDIKNAVKGHLDNQLKLWVNRVSATQDAIAQANIYYQAIMKEQATSPVLDTLLEKLILGVAMMTLPELTGAALIF